jgi:hypothetical protein
MTSNPPSYAEIEKSAGQNDQGSSAAIASLEEKLSEEKQSRKEDRFCFAVIIIILLDVIFFRDFNNWGPPIVIGILEIVLIWVAARKYGVEDFTNLFDKWVDRKKGA